MNKVDKEHNREKSVNEHAESATATAAAAQKSSNVVIEKVEKLYIRNDDSESESEETDGDINASSDDFAQTFRELETIDANVENCGSASICAFCVSKIRNLRSDQDMSVCVAICGHIFHTFCFKKYVQFHPFKPRVNCPICNKRFTNSQYIEELAKFPCLPVHIDLNPMREQVKKLVMRKTKQHYRKAAQAFYNQHTALLQNERGESEMTFVRQNEQHEHQMEALSGLCNRQISAIDVSSRHELELLKETHKNEIQSLERKCKITRRMTNKVVRRNEKLLLVERTKFAMLKAELNFLRKQIFPICSGDDGVSVESITTPHLGSAENIEKIDDSMDNLLEQLEQLEHIVEDSDSTSEVAE